MTIGQDRHLALDERLELVAKGLSIRRKAIESEGGAIMSGRPNAVSAGVTLSIQRGETP